MSVRPDVGLERLIHGLEEELLAAPDEEFVAGARDLGMKPDMKGSAAYVGVKDYGPQLVAALRKAYFERQKPQSPSADCAEPEGGAPELADAAKRNADA